MTSVTSETSETKFLQVPKYLSFLPDKEKNRDFGKERENFKVTARSIFLSLK